GLGCGLALQVERHERGAGLRDGATGTLEGNVADAVTLDPEIDCALVAAAGIVTVCNTVGRGQLAAVSWATVVVQNDGLVEVGEVLHRPESEGQRLRQAGVLANSV